MGQQVRVCVWVGCTQPGHCWHLGSPPAGGAGDNPQWDQDSELCLACLCLISLFRAWSCRASCTPIFGFKMEAGLDVCYLYERYLLTQQIACLCLFSVTSAGSTLNKKFLAPVVCHCGSNTMGPAGVKSAVCVILGSRETQPQAGLCLVQGTAGSAQLGLHSWICTAAGSCCCPRDPGLGPCPPRSWLG